MLSLVSTGRKISILLGVRKCKIIGDLQRAAYDRLEGQRSRGNVETTESVFTATEML